MPRLKATNKIVKTDNGDVTVRRLALGDYARLLLVLDKLPTELSKFIQQRDNAELTDKSSIIAILPKIIGNSIPEFCDVLAVATDKDRDFFMQSSLKDCIEIFVEAMEINNYSEIKELLKKVTARKQQPA